MSTLVTEVSEKKVFRQQDFSIPYVLTAFFVCSWLVAFYTESAALGALITIGLLAFQFTSYTNCLSVLLMSLWIPFFDLLMADVSRALDVHRLFFLPFLLLSFRQPKLRVLPANYKLLWLVLLSLVLLQFSASFQILFRGMPLSAEQEDVSVFQILAYVYDNVIILMLLYFSYTRLSLERLNYVFNLIIFLTALEALAILHLTVLNFELLTRFRSDSILWQNPYFGHKNDWSMVFIFVLLGAVIRNTYQNRNRQFYLISIGIILLGISVSLSRQAYVWALGVFILSALFSGKFKIFGYLTALLIVLLLIQPDFLIERMEGMLNASNQEEFQSLNRKISDMALEQAASNFTLIPRMAYEDWEYNWSEGFWNGFLHQQGILGLGLVIFLYGALFMRFWNLSSMPNRRLSAIAQMGMIMLILMFFANFTRRHTHLMHYKGEIGQIGLLAMFIWLYAETAVRYIRAKKDDYLHL